MSYARMAATRHLDDEYETKQLNPKYSDASKDKASSERIEELTKKLPEKDSIKLRTATCEAVVDDIIETFIEENDGKVNVKTIEDEIEPVVEKAIALHIIPSSFKTKIPHLIAKYLRKRDPLVALHAKTAHYLADAVTQMKEEDTIVSEVLDDKPADTGFDIQEETVEPKSPSQPVDLWHPKKRSKMEAEDASDSDDSGKGSGEESGSEGDSQSSVSEEGGSDTDSSTEGTSQSNDEERGKDDVEVDADLPQPVEDSMRFLTASAVNHRKATALVSRKIGGVLLVNTLYQLRHILPDYYKKKYRIDV